LVKRTEFTEWKGKKAGAFGDNLTFRGKKGPRERIAIGVVPFIVTGKGQGKGKRENTDDAAVKKGEKGTVSGAPGEGKKGVLCEHGVRYSKFWSKKGGIGPP